MRKRAKQSEFIAINLRLPPALHQRLVKSARPTRSLNSEILDRLQKSFDADADKKMLESKLNDLKVALEKEASAVIGRLGKERESAENSLEELTRRVRKLEKRGRG